MPQSVLSESARALQPSVFSQLTPKLKALGDRCIPLHIGDTYRLPPKASLDALKRASDQDLDSTRYFKYTHPFGRAELLDAIVEKLARDNGIRTKADCVQVTCGATQALACVAQSFLDPGDEIIFLCPHWPLIRGICETIGAKVVDAPYTEAVEDPESVLGPLLNDRTKVLYFANPNNPDGQLLDAEKAESLYDFCRSRGLYIWSDEAYEHLVYDGNEKVSIAALDNDTQDKRVISVFTFSKSFGMAGMRVGYAVGPPEIMTAVRRVSTHQIYDLCDLNQEACLAALQQDRADYVSYLKAQRQAYTEARDLLHTAFPDAPLAPGGAYLFVPFESRDAAWSALHTWLEKGVSAAPGEAFGGLHPHCLRLCYTAVPLPRLQQAVDILKGG